MRVWHGCLCVFVHMIMTEVASEFEHCWYEGSEQVSEGVSEEGDDMEFNCTAASPQSVSLSSSNIPSISYNMISLSYQDSSTHTEPLTVTVPLSALSPDVSVVDEFCTTPFVAAAESVSQIMSKVGSVDDLIWVGTTQEWFLWSVEECSIDYVDALILTMKLDWHTHASSWVVVLIPLTLST
jgi:hypothetical protein